MRACLPGRRFQHRRMRKSIYLLWCLFPVTLQAEDLNAGGIVYKNYTVSRVDPDGLRITHADGAAKVRYELLPPELQKKYHFDPAKAEAFRKEQAEKGRAVPAAPAPSPAPATPAAPPVPAAAGAKPEASAPGAAPAAPAGKAKLPEIVIGKVYGLAEVNADLHKLDGKIVRVEVVVNTASKIESVGKGIYEIFVGDSDVKDSDYTRVAFPEEGKNKVKILTKSKTGKMNLWIEVRASETVPLWAVGRTLRQGQTGTRPTLSWD